MPKLLIGSVKKCFITNKMIIKGFRSIFTYLFFGLSFPFFPVSFLSFFFPTRFSHSLFEIHVYVLNLVTSMYVIIWSKFPLTSVFASVRTAKTMISL